MSKFTYALLSVVIIEFALYLFAGSSYTNTSLLGLITDPTETNTLWVAALAIMGIVAVAGIVASAFFQISTFGVFAGLAVSTFTFGTTLFNLWKYINGSLTELGTTLAPQIASFIVAPLVIFYLIATLEWARGNT